MRLPDIKKIVILIIFGTFFLYPTQKISALTITQTSVNNSVSVNVSGSGKVEINTSNDSKPRPMADRPLDETSTSIRNPSTQKPTITQSQTQTLLRRRINPTQTPTNTPTPTPTKSITPTKTPTPTQSNSSLLDTKQTYILNAINDYRKSQGLYEVKADKYTCDFAKVRAKEIVTSFNHDGFRDRINADNLPYPSYSRVTENLAMTSNYANVVTMWINSSGHAANMRADTPYVCVAYSGNYYAYEGWKP